MVTFPRYKSWRGHGLLEWTLLLTFVSCNSMGAANNVDSASLRSHVRGRNVDGLELHSKEHPSIPVRWLQKEVSRNMITTSANLTDGNLLNTVSNELNDVVTSSPTSWSTAQKIGVAIGSVVAILLLVALCMCGRRYCRRRGVPQAAAASKTTTATITQIKDNADLAYYMKRPYVKRSSRSVTPINAMDPTTFPLCAQLHGALKLRNDNLLGQNIRVAVIDSGIDKDHPGFHGKVKRQVWYRKGTPLSQDDHGTHVAGTIHMMAPEAELYDYRVFGAEGDLDGDDAIAASIREAVDKDNCHIINMSLRVSYPIVPAVKQSVDYAYSKGVHMVCAAGNSGDGDPTTNEMYAFPARWKETISVAAVQKEGSLPVAFFSESNPQVDFAAIGVDVISLKPGGGYQEMQGTSMAAPHVSGLIAALLSNNGSKYSPRALKKFLTKYAIDIGAKGPDTSTGVGFVTYLSSKKELEDMLSSSSASTSSSRMSGSKGAIRAQAY